MRSRKIKFLLPKPKHRSAHYKATQKPQNPPIKDPKTTREPRKSPPRPRPVESHATTALPAGLPDLSEVRGTGSQHDGPVARWPAQLEGQGSKGIRCRKQEAEEQGCVYRNVHIFRRVRRSGAAGGCGQDPPTLLGPGGTRGFCLWGVWSQPPSKLGEPHPRCPPALGFTSESVQRAGAAGGHHSPQPHHNH